MWYTYLLKLLAMMICPSDQDGAAKYIDILMKLVKSEFHDHPDFEAGFVFGLIGALYRYYELTSRHKLEVSLQDFARISFGFVILYYKATEDQTVYCSDFMSVIDDRRIYSKLGLTREISKALNDYVEGCFSAPGLTPFSKLKKKSQYIENKEQIKVIIYLNKLKEYEADALRLLSFNVKSDIRIICRVLNELINLTKDKYFILHDLEKFLAPYRNKEEVFDNLIHSIHLEKGKCEGVDADSGPSPQIKLNLKPPYFYFAHSKLKAYVEYIPACGPGLFQKKQIRGHIDKVREVLEGIQKDQFNSIAEILNELSKIKIANSEDLLIAIIDEITKAVKSNLKETIPHVPEASPLGHSS